MEPHPAPGRRGSSGCAGGCAGGCARGCCAVLGGRLGPGAPGRDADTSRGDGCTPGGGTRAFFGAWMHPRGRASIPGRDGCTPGGMQAFLGGTAWVLLRMDAPRGGECASFSTAGSSYLSAAPTCPPKAGNVQTSPASSPVCRGALQQGSGGLWKPSLCGAGGCLRGAGGCGVGRDGAWVSPTTNFSLLGRPGPLLRRESPPCGIDRHRLLNMHITRRGIAPLRLPPALPPPALSFSQRCCFPLVLLGVPAFLHPRGFPGAGSPRPPGCQLCREPGWGVKGRGSPRGGIKVPLSLLTPPAQNLCFIYFIISLFYYFLMLALGLLT